jgi:predicted DNA-binding transcriptional regulator YafY
MSTNKKITDTKAKKVKTAPKGKKREQRSNTLCLLNILREHSDEDHPLPMNELIDKMAKHGLSIERKAVYDCLATLRKLGYDVSEFKDSSEGYYLGKRELEVAEVRLIMDSIYMNRGIPAPQSAELIKKLQEMSLSAHRRKNYTNLTSEYKETKTPNKDVFLNIEILDEAITQKKRVSFTYLGYDFKKKLIPRRSEKYIMSPYGLVVADEFYYLVGIYKDHEQTSHYRVDRMEDIKILKDDIKPPPKNFDIYKFTKESVYRQSGKAERITIKCHNNILNDVIDKFGTAVNITHSKDDPDHFLVRLTANPKGLKYWLLQYLEFSEVLSPESLRDEVKRIIDESAY